MTENTIDLAQKAGELLNNSSFTEAVRVLDEQCIEEWKMTQPTETAEREAIYHKQQGLAAIVSALIDMHAETALVDDPLDNLIE